LGDQGGPAKFQGPKIYVVHCLFFRGGGKRGARGERSSPLFGEECRGPKPVGGGAADKFPLGADPGSTGKGPARGIFGGWGWGTKKRRGLVGAAPGRFFSAIFFSGGGPPLGFSSAGPKRMFGGGGKKNLGKYFLFFPGGSLQKNSSGEPKKNPAPGECFLPKTNKLGGKGPRGGLFFWVVLVRGAGGAGFLKRGNRGAAPPKAGGGGGPAAFWGGGGQLGGGGGGNPTGPFPSKKKLSFPKQKKNKKKKKKKLKLEVIADYCRGWFKVLISPGKNKPLNIYYFVFVKKKGGQKNFHIVQKPGAGKQKTKKPGGRDREKQNRQRGAEALSLACKGGVGGHGASVTKKGLEGASIFVFWDRGRKKFFSRFSQGPKMGGMALFPPGLLFRTPLVCADNHVFVPTGGENPPVGRAIIFSAGKKLSRKREQNPPAGGHPAAPAKTPQTKAN